ncbi:acyltransferase [Rhodococcus ruber]|uniref:Acyltransferase n=1 Tax=Rhodococcus ruber TaxID=1830 RepID=A0ABT4MAR7_9NOCA|nr:acyltransferase [Rhodococcus ruber]MCZ4518048.1 acyltransferase [Rhodococcus ruber]
MTDRRSRIRHLKPVRFISSRPPGPPRQLELDAIRGVAILLAMGWHLNSLPSENSVYNFFMAPGRVIGWAGVDLFFVLSGFLVGRLLLEEQLHRTTVDGKRFLIRRAFKLWPVLYVFLFAQLIFGDMSWNTYLAQTIFHIQNYTHGSISHLWSLAVEEHFYLILVGVITIFSTTFRSSRHLLALMFSLLISCLALRVSAYAFGSGLVELQTYSHFRFDSLAAGVILAIMAVNYPKQFTKLLLLRPMFAIVACAGVTWLVLVPKNTALGSTIGYTIAYLTGAALLLTVYRADFVIKAPLCWQWLGVLGTYSYGLYIWHIAAGNFGEILFRKIFDDSVGTVVLTIVKYLSALTIAVFVTKIVEWPSLQLRNKLFPSRTTIQPDGDASRGTNTHRNASDLPDE